MDFKMFKFTIFVALCVALFYQATATEELGSAANEFKKAIDKLMNAVNKALHQAEDELNRALNKVKSKATELENKATQELEKTLGPLRNKLNDLVAKAKAKGVDVSKCANYVDDFTKIPENLVHNLNDCINSQVNKAQNLVNDALKNARKIKDDLKFHCGGNVLKKAKCFAKLIPKIIKDSTSVPQHILEDVAKITVQVETLIPVMEACFTNQLNKAGQDANNDVAGLSNCVGIPL